MALERAALQMWRGYSVHVPRCAVKKPWKPPHEPLGTSNIEHPTSNTQPPINGPIGNHWLFDVGCFPSVHGFNARIFRGILSMNPGNIQHPTSNTQHPKTRDMAAFGCSMLGVGCWMFSIGSGIQC